MKQSVKAMLLAIWKSDAGYAFHARFHDGAEYYEAPYMQVYVGMDKSGVITGVVIGEFVDHTQSFVDMVTAEYIVGAYVGQTGSASFVVDGVSGATFTSDTVQYAVRFCSRYAQAVLRLLKEEAQDGRAFTALVVRSGFVPGNPANNMTLPTYQIWIDSATHEIFQADMLTGATPEGNDTTLSVSACFIAAAQYYCSVIR